MQLDDLAVLVSGKDHTTENTNLSTLQTECAYLLRILSTKMHIHMSLVSIADIHVRKAVSSAIASHLASLEGPDVNTQGLSAMLQTEMER